MKPTRFQGRLWLLTGPDGELLDDIDTDMIFHNAHLAITDEVEMGPFALGNLAGWKHFAAEVQPGDMVAAGANFGAGSSRQHAVDCFRALGVSALLCRSYGAIYWRNGVNAGFPLLVWEQLDGQQLAHLDHVDVDMLAGTIASDDAPTGRLASASQVQLDIYRAGDLFAYARERKESK